MIISVQFSSYFNDAYSFATRTEMLFFESTALKFHQKPKKAEKDAKSGHNKSEIENESLLLVYLT